MKPADLALTKYELVVKLKTAKALAHKVSQGVLARAAKALE